MGPGSAISQETMGNWLSVLVAESSLLVWFLAWGRPCGCGNMCPGFQVITRGLCREVQKLSSLSAHTSTCGLCAHPGFSPSGLSCAPAPPSGTVGPTLE